MTLGGREFAAGHGEGAAGACQVPAGDGLAELARDVSQFVEIGLGGIDVSELAASLDPPEPAP